MINPFSIWMRTMGAMCKWSHSGLQLAETLAASQAVIAIRSEKLQRALHSPLDGDYPEFHRMVTEKVEAFSQANSAMAAIWWDIQADWLAESRQLTSMALAGRPPTPTELFERAAEVVDHGTRTVERSAALSAGAMNPIHARATANARRLTRQL